MKYWGTTGRSNRLFFMRLLGVQVVAGVFVAVSLWGLVGNIAARSALCGVLIYLLPALYQTRQVLTHNDSNNIRATLRQLYKSEIWKMALTIVLFGLVFVLVKPIEPFSLFGAYVAMQLIAWLAPVVKNFNRF